MKLRHFIRWFSKEMRKALNYESEPSGINQSTGNYFRILRIVSKNNFLVIKISQPTALDSLSVL